VSAGVSPAVAAPDAASIPEDDVFEKVLKKLIEKLSKDQSTQEAKAY
jgi:hypothetical protein